jgi:hypothetical protein
MSRSAFGPPSVWFRSVPPVNVLASSSEHDICSSAPRELVGAPHALDYVWASAAVDPVATDLPMEAVSRLPPDQAVVPPTAAQ